MGGGEATSLYSFSQGSGLKSDVFDDLAGCASSDYFDSEILRRRKLRVNEEIMQRNNNFRMRIGNFEEAKNQILSYVPGAWIEEVGGMKKRDYDIPKTATLLLLGPRGSGKSSLVNRISRIFEDSNFTSERAQVSSYNSTVGDGTHFLKEYMIPRDSTSFCLYDTPSLLENSCDNLEIIKNWLTVGVRHGEMVIRDSDTSSMRKTVKCKTQQADYYSRETRMVNFVIFVVDGPSVLKSMEGEDNAQYARLLVETFNCPYLSFKDDKPVVVITHGDLLSCSDRDHIRIHLGELLGIPPTKQIFDISEKNDPETDLTVLDMLRYSLEHADRNLSNKCLAQDMVLRELPTMILTCITLFTFLGIFYTWHVIFYHLCSSEILDWLGILQLGCRSKNTNWHEIRSLSLFFAASILLLFLSFLELSFSLAHITLPKKFFKRAGK